jgi:hypothetical protein
MLCHAVEPPSLQNYKLNKTLFFINSPISDIQNNMVLQGPSLHAKPHAVTFADVSVSISKSDQHVYIASPELCDGVNQELAKTYFLLSERSWPLQGAPHGLRPATWYSSLPALSLDSRGKAWATVEEV